MSIVFLRGGIILWGRFFYSRIHHFTSLGYLAGCAKMKGIPAPKPAVIGIGVFLARSGFCLLLRVLPMISCILLLIFLAGDFPFVHAFGRVRDVQQRTIEMINFIKNTALAGALPMILTLPAPRPVSL
jgi:putative oxidoreductase